MDTNGLPLLVAIAVVSFVLAYYGSAVGLILGHLRLPLLVYYLPSTAAGMATNLAVSGLGAVTGMVRHGRDGRISLPLFALMGVPSVLGAVLGGALLLKIDSGWARVAIGCGLLGSGTSVFTSRFSEAASVTVFGVWRMLAEVVVGLGIGFLAAVTGLMLGSLRLPMMVR